MIRILHLSDPHFGAADPDVAEAFLQQAEALAPELEPVYTQDGLNIISLNSSRPFGFHRDWPEGRLSLERWSRSMFRSIEANRQSGQKPCDRHRANL